ncbi:MAG TPA: DUF2092 domain-containing protein [Chthonomonadaceae bacterium]|nr:DUF2092 domain-containing protein [Chthonomonadaceae bacterium]
MYVLSGESTARLYIALRRHALVGLALICGLAGMAGAQRNAGSPAAGVQSARDILQKSINTYQEMSSYEGQSNIDQIKLNPQGGIIQQEGSSAKMRYKRPNKLMLDFTTPVGSRSIWSDGSLLIVYDALPKKYTVGPTAPDLSAMLPLLFRRAGVTASLDPLYGLSKKTLPKELVNLALQETTTFNGHPVYVVTGTLKGIETTNANKQPITLPSSTWTWWIDKNTFLMHKIETRTANVILSPPQSGGPQRQAATPATLVARYTFSASKPNCAFPENAFNFKAPPDASERK